MSRRPASKADRMVRVLSRRIARDLFTSGLGQRAHRLVLVSDLHELPHEKLGAWSESGLGKRIEYLLNTVR